MSEAKYEVNALGKHHSFAGQFIVVSEVEGETVVSLTRKLNTFDMLVAALREARQQAKEVVEWNEAVSELVGTKRPINQFSRAGEVLAIIDAALAAAEGMA